MNPLVRYLKRNRLGPRQFARDTGLPPITIWRIATGQRGAGVAMIAAIEKATGGAVRAEDWIRHRRAA